MNSLGKYVWMCERELALLKDLANTHTYSVAAVAATYTTEIFSSSKFIFENKTSRK